MNPTLPESVDNAEDDSVDRRERQSIESRQGRDEELELLAEKKLSNDCETAEFENAISDITDGNVVPDEIDRSEPSSSDKSLSESVSSAF